MAISKIQWRSVVHFLTSEKCPAEKIYTRLAKCYGVNAQSKATLYRWIRLFQQGQTSLEDDPRPGRPVSATDSENIKKVETFVNTDRRLKLSQIAQ